MITAPTSAVKSSLKKILRTGCMLSLVGGLLMLSDASALARDAAFMDPSTSSGSSDVADAIKVEPKAEVEAGDTFLGIARRTSLFFTNQTSLPIQIEKINVNGDGNVAAEISNDDCSKQATLAPQSRCSVEVSVTPNSPGAWGVDVLMTHNGPGRIVRAKISGKTSGTAGNDKDKSMGLAMAAKEAAPITFGEVEVNTGKAVRSALMINDSTEPITILSIDVIEADNGLQRLEQGCAVDMELKPGESCPVTMLWAPKGNGAISTDLIIRHSGKMGFSVIPIRGTTKGGDTATANARGKDDDKNKIMLGGSALSVKPPPSMTDLDAAAKQIPASALKAPPTTDVRIRLIGTVGNRAIIMQPDGTTAVLGAGDAIEVGSDTDKVIVTAVGAKSVDISVNGKKKTFELGAAPELIARASTVNQPNDRTIKPVTTSTSVKTDNTTKTTAPNVPNTAPPLSANPVATPAGNGAGPSGGMTGDTQSGYMGLPGGTATSSPAGGL